MINIRFLMLQDIHVWIMGKNTGFVYLPFGARGVMFSGGPPICPPIRLFRPSIRLSNQPLLPADRRLPARLGIFFFHFLIIIIKSDTWFISPCLGMDHGKQWFMLYNLLYCYYHIMFFRAFFTIISRTHRQKCLQLCMVIYTDHLQN